MNIQLLLLFSLCLFFKITRLLFFFNFTSKQLQTQYSQGKRRHFQTFLTRFSEFTFRLCISSLRWRYSSTLVKWLAIWILNTLLSGNRRVATTENFIKAEQFKWNSYKYNIKHRYPIKVHKGFGGWFQRVKEVLLAFLTPLGVRPQIIHTKYECQK